METYQRQQLMDFYSIAKKLIGKNKNATMITIHNADEFVETPRTNVTNDHNFFKDIDNVFHIKEIHSRDDRQFYGDVLQMLVIKSKRVLPKTRQEFVVPHDYKEDLLPLHIGWVELGIEAGIVQNPQFRKYQIVNNHQEPQTKLLSYNEISVSPYIDMIENDPRFYKRIAEKFSIEIREYNESVYGFHDDSTLLRSLLD